MEAYCSAKSAEYVFTVTLLPIILPRSFPDRIGFHRAIRQVMGLPADPVVIALFQKLIPAVDWSSTPFRRPWYDPPRWFGYWGATQIYWATDGLLKLQVSNVDELDLLFLQIQAASFPRHRFLPFVTPHREPSHLLLHDLKKERIYVAPFEQGEAILVRQRRPFS